MHRCIRLGLACYLGGIGMTLGENVLAQTTASPVSNCTSPDALAVVNAEKLPTLLGKPVHQITFLHYRGQQLLPITSQIDQRDADGRYRLGKETAADELTPLLEPNDEVVFRMADRATRLPPDIAGAEEVPLIEIGITDAETGQVSWVYARLSEAIAKPLSRERIAYEATTDSIETASYKAGFSRRNPFLLDRFQWKLGADNWSPNVLDTMKISHQGDMFGFIPFQRTAEDYSSRLTRVKTGPLRVIRRTENRVRILWQLKTPTLYVDYVMMPGSFIMDTIVDIPFNLGLFFNDVETVTTVDWLDGPTLPKLTIRSPGIHSGLRVNGQMNDEKHHFNTISDTRFSVHSEYGAVSVILDIPDDFPIHPWLYLNDQIDVADAPENQPGQFGNAGYRTTGWENIDTEVHHLKFTTCLTATEANHGS